MNIQKAAVTGGILLFGLLTTVGFAFGPMASYANLGGGGNNQQQTDTITLPNSTYSEEPFDLSFNQQRQLAAQTDVVFVAALHKRSPEYDLSSVSSDLRGRVYIQSVNYTESAIDERYGINEFPAAVVVGANRAQPVSIVRNISESNVRQAACDGFRSWSSPRGSVVSVCQQ